MEYKSPIFVVLHKINTQKDFDEINLFDKKGKKGF